MMEENLNQTNSPSREEWRFPLLARFQNWVIGFGAAAVLILAALYGAYLVMRPDVAVVDTQPAIADVGIPISPPTKSITAKTATKKQAAQAINTSAIAINRVINSPVTPPSAPAAEPLTPAEQDFANRLAIFESKTP